MLWCFVSGTVHGCHSYRPHSYGHTDPMYPPTLLPLLSTPASLSFLQLQCKEKKAVWLKSKYFFFFYFSKSECQRLRAEGKGALGNTYFPESRGFSMSTAERKGWWLLVTHLHVYFCVSFPPYIPLLATQILSLCLPHPQLPCLHNGARQSYNVIQRNTCELKW